MKDEIAFGRNMDLQWGMDTPLQDSSPTQALKKAIDAAGGNTALAARLGISRPAVAQWTVCPPLRVLQIEALTGVSRHELRPDLYPTALDSSVSRT